MIITRNASAESHNFSYDSVNYLFIFFQLTYEHMQLYTNVIFHNYFCICVSNSSVKYLEDGGFVLITLTKELRK